MTRWLGVALLPRADHTRAAIRLQQSLGGDQPLQPPLSEEGNLPHLTVFQGPFEDSLDPARELARTKAALSLPDQLSLASVGIVHQPTGWLFMSVERPALLEKLQEVVLDGLAPRLDRQAFDTSKDTSRFTDAERASFARYGYRYTGEAYAPHITLGRTDEATALELVRTAPERTRVPAEWIFDRFSFYVMGEHGAHAEKLAELPVGAV
ncbi:2'-5' RNA ligase family protein [Streptomyces cyaneofuscatus]|uniref:2'-5' RNA ligase family protein n=1 Tax=Streptomyces cyaneofuscatus TaxID=66883 RepID=UPI0029548B19|nr:2'-5' RNA ligase family protein [Streptomyces cyaneofuscatus]WOP10881.1 2'-5' RNA ligase family protein [Streptomyces cyaneofuscatus]